MNPEWRGMRAEDLSAVLRIADAVHPELPETESVFAERMLLFPQGCIVLANGTAVEGYAVSHPIRRFEPPRLNTMLGVLTRDADDYYIHDFVVGPERRGTGLANAGVKRLLEIARPYETASLISVYGSGAFWSRFGFMPADRDMRGKLEPYGIEAVYMLRKSSGRDERREAE